MDPLARALRFTWTFSDRSADRVTALDGVGTVLRTPSLGDAWSLNALRIEVPRDDLDLDAAEALAAAHLDTAYLQLLVEDERTALRLLAAARGDDGWNRERHVLMALEGVPPASQAPTRDGTVDEVAALMAEWLSGDGQPSAVVEQLVARTRREHRIGEQRRIVADHAGEAARRSCSSWPTTRTGPRSCTRRSASPRSAAGPSCTARPAKPSTRGCDGRRRSPTPRAGSARTPRRRRAGPTPTAGRA